MVNCGGVRVCCGTGQMLLVFLVSLSCLTLGKDCCCRQYNDKLSFLG